MGDRHQVGKPSWYVTSHPGKLSLVILSFCRKAQSVPAKVRMPASTITQVGVALF